MATTDTRTGFRLPWSTDRAASREASADTADELVAAAPSTESDAAAAPQPETGNTSDQDATGDGVRGQEEELVTILAPDTAQHAPAAAPTASDPVDPGTPPFVTNDTQVPEPAVAPSPSRRPSKFLADLTRAMQAAAEQARTATLEQYRSEGTAVIEQIHARSATSATELKRHADDDVSAIKEWSKAEIARIREETEQRTAARREQLEGQLERHAAIIEHEIEQVRGRIAAFEAEMGRFFDDLVGEGDPALFAARAASLPEPPSFENPDDDAIAALLHEPGVGVPAPVVEAVEATEEAVAEGPTGEIVAAGTLEAEAVASEPVEAIVEAQAEATDGEHADAAATVADMVDATADVETAVDAPAEVEAGLEAPQADVEPADREAAMAAIQAAAEAAATTDTADPTWETAVVEEAAPVDAANGEAQEPAPDEAAQPGDDVGSGEPSHSFGAPFSQNAEIDPRLAMLGLTPDFAAAEMAAAEAAAADTEEMPEIGGEALEARLSGLVGSDTPAAPVATVTTQVVVTGLVSVASIASFKRHLGRLAGVAHVGVSSGPDGEFLFTIEHEPEVALRELIPTIPGFGARVVGSSDGTVHVSAQDLQD